MSLHRDCNNRARSLTSLDSLIHPPTHCVHSLSPSPQPLVKRALTLLNLSLFHVSFSLTQACFTCLLQLRHACGLLAHFDRCQRTSFGNGIRLTCVQTLVYSVDRTHCRLHCCRLCGQRASAHLTRRRCDPSTMFNV